MFVLLLTACDHEDAMGDARARATAFLDGHPSGTAMVQVPLDASGIEGVVGTRWHGADLAEWLAPCATAPGTPAAAFVVELRLEPGEFPWEVLDDGDAPACVADRLATFPFDEPSRRAEVDLVVVRWRPTETADTLVKRDASLGAGVPAGLLALAPPYYRRSASGDALELDEDLLIDDGRVRLRATRVDDVVAGMLEAPDAWARKLTCPADTLGLVRTTLVFHDGYLEARETWPDTECVEEKAGDERLWLREQTVGGVRVADAGRVLVVIDVPVGAW